MGVKLSLTFKVIIKSVGYKFNFFIFTVKQCFFEFHKK